MLISELRYKVGEYADFYRFKKKDIHILGIFKCSFIVPQILAHPVFRVGLLKRPEKRVPDPRKQRFRV